MRGFQLFVKTTNSKKKPLNDNLKFKRKTKNKKCLITSNSKNKA